MKKNSFATVCILLLLYCTISCTEFYHHDINITITESGHYYKLFAHYNSNHSYEVDKCMDKHFGKASNMSFVNAHIDGDIAMDDGTNFYIKKKEGYLEIKFDKSENSSYSYHEIKTLGEDLKYAMQQ